MNFANPSALFWVALAIPVVIFYILKIRLRRVPVSTVIFWRQIFEEKKPRSLWQRLRHLLSLFVQLLLLFLLIGALTEPFFAWEITQARRLVLVVDNSASMNATDVAPSRLSRAKDESHRIIAGMRFRDEMAIVAAGTQPRVICGLTGHQRTLRGALDSIDRTDGPTRLAEAVALARRLATEESGEHKSDTQVVVITDGCVEGAAKLAKADDVQLIAVGERTGNVGISRFQVRRSPLDPTGYEILAEVVNQSDDPVTCRLELDLNGAVQDVIPIKIEPNDKWSQVIQKVATEGGRLQARLTDPADGKIDHVDALAADNRAVAILPKREFQNVFLTRPEINLFLEKVLEANSLVRLTTGKQPPAAVPANAVHVFHRDVPNPLPAGAVLVIDPANNCDLWEVGEKLPTPMVTTHDKESPLMANVRLDNVLMPEARKLTFLPAAGKPRVLAGAITGDPLFAMIERPTGKVVVLTVNLDMGDLPFRTAFPILVSNTLGEFSGGRGELHEALSTGAVAEVSVPTLAPIDEALLRSPSGTTQKLPTGVPRTTVGPLDQCGIWAVVTSKTNDAKAAAEAKPVEEIACNLTNRAESDLRPPKDLPAQPATVQAGFISDLLGRPTWFFLIMLAWLLAAVEWFLYQRRWIS